MNSYDGFDVFVDFADAGYSSEFKNLANTNKEWRDKSAEVLAKAMDAIKGMANQIGSINFMERPTSVEMTFGLKLTSDANVFIASAGAETQIIVKMVWSDSKKSDELEES